MTVTPTIVCVIPVHDDAAHIGLAIDSLLAQTLPPGRIVVVDDGSTEPIRPALARFGPVVEYIRQPRSGPATARNLGAAGATEEFIAFLDSDDRYDPARFATAVGRMRSDPAVGGTVCLAQNVDENASPVGDPIPAFTCGALVVRRTALATVGPFDPTLPHGSALQWYIRAREAGVRIEVDEPALLLRLLRPTSMSHTDGCQSHSEHLAVLRASLQRRRGASG